MKPGHFLEFVDFLSFMVNKHLEQQSLSFFADEIMHGLINFDSIFDGSFSSLDE